MPGEGFCGCLRGLWKVCLVLEVMLRPRSSLEKGDSEGLGTGKSASRGQGQCVHLCGNHRTCERGVCQGAWRAAQLPGAVPGQQCSGSAGGDGRRGSGEQ